MQKLSASIFFGCVRKQDPVVGGGALDAQLCFTGAEYEVVADWIGKNLYKSGFAQAIVNGDATVGNTFVQVIDKLRLAMGNKKSRSHTNLAVVERLFMRALENETQTRAGTEIRNALLNPNELSREDGITLMEMCEHGELGLETFIPVSKTTPNLVIEKVKNDIVLKKLPMMMNVKKVQQMIEESDIDDGGSRLHGIDAKTASAIFEGMFDPQYIVYQAENNRVGILVKMPNKYKGIALVVIAKDRDFNADILNGYKGGAYNVSVTLYGLDDVNYYLSQDEHIIRYDKSKANHEEAAGSHVPSLSNDSPYSNTRLSQNDPRVNTQSMQNAPKNSSSGQLSFLPPEMAESGKPDVYQEHGERAAYLAEDGRDTDEQSGTPDPTGNNGTMWASSPTSTGEANGAIDAPLCGGQKNKKEQLHPRGDIISAIGSKARGATALNAGGRAEVDIQENDARPNLPPISQTVYNNAERLSSDDQRSFCRGRCPHRPVVVIKPKFP